MIGRSMLRKHVGRHTERKPAGPRLRASSSSSHGYVFVMTCQSRAWYLLLDLPRKTIRASSRILETSSLYSLARLAEISSKSACVSNFSNAYLSFVGVPVSDIDTPLQTCHAHPSNASLISHISSNPHVSQPSADPLPLRRPHSKGTLLRSPHRLQTKQRREIQSQKPDDRTGQSSSLRKGRRTRRQSRKVD